MLTEDAKRQDFGLHAGSYRRLIVTVNDEDGQPINLTGATIKWNMATFPRLQIVVCKDNNSPDLTILEQTGPTLGQFQIDLSPDDTKNLMPGQYYHEARVTDAFEHPDVVLYGYVTLKASTTLSNCL